METSRPVRLALAKVKFVSGNRLVRSFKSRFNPVRIATDEEKSLNSRARIATVGGGR